MAQIQKVRLRNVWSDTDGTFTPDVFLVDLKCEVVISVDVELTIETPIEEAIDDFDSLLFTHVLMALESLYDIRLDHEHASQAVTLNELYELIRWKRHFRIAPPEFPL